MPFRVSGKNIDIGEALRARVNERVAEATAKYFDGGFSGHVTIGKEGFGFRTECVIHLDSGIVLEAEALATLAARGWQPDYLTLRRRADLSVPDVYSLADGLVALGAARLGGTRLIDNIEF